jgi:heat shock transcription factor
VLDEDEFARTLIPELFKHNNYASFVRQLNMYGFHKKVGLSDNSMKASETKAKAPSEYFNKYFKRGRPELLWLIQKPKNPPTNVKRKRGEDEKNGDSDEDRKYLPDTGGGGGGGSGGGGGGGNRGYVEELSVRGNSEMAMIPRTEYNSLRGEVQALQNQQKVISNVLTQIKRQNDELYSQANTFRTLHERHENSINAILTFLATFYNRSLEGQNNSVNFADMFGPAIPAQQPHGNVVDVGDYPEEPVIKSPQAQRTTQRRPLALLPAPAIKDSLSPSDRAATLSPSIRSTASPHPKPASRAPAFKAQSNQTRPPANYNNRPMKDATPAGPIKVDTGSPPNLGQSVGNDAIMSAIQNVNANTPQSANQNPGYDLSAALSNYQTQDGNVPLTTQQRADVLSLMNSATGASQNTNNALVSPQPPMPSLEQFQATAAQLDFLQKMSEDQNSRVQNLQERLQPLSPSGSIPGLTDNSYFGASALGDPGAYDLDLDSFVQGDDFFPDNNDGQNGMAGNGGDNPLPDLNFELPDTGMDGVEFQNAVDGDGYGASPVFNGKREGRIESVSSSATSPTATVEDVEDESVAKRNTPKRRRK